MLLRRVGFKTYRSDNTSETIWSGATLITQQQVKAVLLEGYEKETIVVVRNKLCDTIADIARYDEEEDRLLPFR